MTLLMVLLIVAMSIQQRFDAGPVSFSVMEIAILPIIVSFFVRQINQRGSIYISHHLLIFLSLFYVVIAAVFRPWATNMTNGLSDIRDWVVPFVLLVLLSGSVRVDWRRWSVLFVFVAFFSAIFGLYQVQVDDARPFIIEGALYKTGFDFSGDGLELTSQSFAAGLFSHPNRFAQFLFVGLCIGQGWLMRGSPLWTPLKSVIVTVLAVTIYFTYAKASLISVVITLALVWFIYLFRRAELILSILLVSLGVSFLIFILVVILPILDTTLLETFYWRVDLWERSLALLRTDPQVLLTGNGLDQLIEVFPPGISEPHNVFVFMALQYGLLGLGLHIVFVIAFILVAINDARTGVFFAEPLLGGIWAALFGFMLVGLVESNLQEIELRMLYFFLIACYVGLSRQVRFEQAKRASWLEEGITDAVGTNR